MNACKLRIFPRFSRILLLLAVIFLFSACAAPGGTTSSTSSPTAHPQVVATQPPLIVHIPNGPITYAALGASDAVGVGSNQPGSQGYVPLVEAHLPKGSHSINLGISGIRLHKALTAELPLALTTSPGLVTIWLVANDFIAGVTYGD